MKQIENQSEQSSKNRVNILSRVLSAILIVSAMFFKDYNTLLGVTAMISVYLPDVIEFIIEVKTRKKFFIERKYAIDLIVFLLGIAFILMMDLFYSHRGL